MAKGIHAESVAPEFLEHAKQEQAHADRIAERIVSARRRPGFFPPRGSARAVMLSTWRALPLVDMIKEDLVAECVAIESYLEMIAYLEGRDPTTRRLLEEILANEEEHADDLNSLLEGLREQPPLRSRFLALATAWPSVRDASETREALSI